MDRSVIERETLAIIRQRKALPDDVDPTRSLQDAGIDSLDALEILFSIEEKFRISIPDDRVREIRTIADMVSTIESLLPDHRA